MSLKTLLSAGFIFHAILGSFCMIPMSYAMESQIPHEDHEEIAMTPMTAVTSGHCAECMQAELSARHMPPMSPSCAGHCLSQAKDAAMGALFLSSPQVHFPVAIVQPISWKLQFGFTRSLVARPPDPISTQTIVLRV
jgi:hypothetical protein